MTVEVPPEEVGYGVKSAFCQMTWSIVREVGLNVPLKVCRYGFFGRTRAVGSMFTEDKVGPVEPFQEAVYP
jgi:hypothetical protein